MFSQSVRYQISIPQFSDLNPSVHRSQSLGSQIDSCLSEYFILGGFRYRFGCSNPAAGYDIARIL